MSGRNPSHQNERSPVACDHEAPIGESSSPNAENKHTARPVLIGASGESTA